MSNIFDVSNSLASSINDVLKKNVDLKQRDLESRYGIKHENPGQPEPGQPIKSEDGEQ